MTNPSIGLGKCSIIDGISLKASPRSMNMTMILLLQQLSHPRKKVSSLKLLTQLKLEKLVKNPLEGIVVAKRWS